MNLLPRFLCIPVLCTILFTTSSWAAALWLYEGGTPNLGTAALARQIRIGTGIQYDWNEDVTVGVAYEHLYAREGEIDQEGEPLQGPLKGEYDPNVIHFFAINLIWKF